MDRRTIMTNEAPPAVGPYVQAFQAGDMVFCSGQIPMKPHTGEMVDSDIIAATEQAILNLQAVLEANDMRLADVVKTTVYLDDMDDFEGMNKAYARYFSNTVPARACVEVARLPKDALVEIEAVAVRS